MESLRTVLEAAIADGGASLPNEDEDGSTTLSLEAVIALWAAVRERDRADGRAPRSPEHLKVAAERGSTVRAVLRVGGHRYRVDVVGRSDALCFVTGCPWTSIGAVPLQTCSDHLDHPEHAPDAAAHDPAGLTADRTRAWRERTDLAYEHLRDDHALLRRWEAVVEQLTDEEPIRFDLPDASDGGR
ncbi:hypothetical protein [Kitasatospora sp. NBC_01539]|uniref:hypothetical protein n=1 Tax=Kitasatospora sp. NBC_01539 TaxID=2903577 RepID=UPI0038600E5B